MQISQTEQCLCPSNAGFTLVELLVVLAVVAAVTVTASMSLSSLSGSVALRNSAYELRTLITASRRDAIASGEPITLSWKDSSWTVSTQTGTQERARNSRLTVSFIPAFSDSGAALELFPDGTSTGGTFRLATAGGQSLDVATSWITGGSAIVWSSSISR